MSTSETMTEAAPLRLHEFLPYRLSVISEAISRLFAERYEQEFGPQHPRMASHGGA